MINKHAITGYFGDGYNCTSIDYCADNSTCHQAEVIIYRLEIFEYQIPGSRHLYGHSWKLYLQLHWLLGWVNCCNFYSS